MQIFAQKISRLSPGIKDVLYSPDTAYIIEEICHDFNLSVDQGSELARAPNDILINDLSLVSFVDIISSKLYITREISTKVAGEVVREIFLPAIEDIKKAQAQKFGLRTTRTRDPRTQDLNPHNVVNLREDK